MARVRGEDQSGFIDVLESWLAHQPWFPSHRGRRHLVRVGGLRLAAPAGDPDPHLALEMHVFEVHHPAADLEHHRERIAVPVALRSRPSTLAGKSAFIGKLSVDSGEEIWVYDGARDQAFLAALLEMVRRQQGSRNGRSRGEAFAGFKGWPPFTAQLRRTSGEMEGRPVTRTTVTCEGADGENDAGRVLVDLHRRPVPERDVALETAVTLTMGNATTVPPVLGVVRGAWIVSAPDQSAVESTIWESGDLAVIRGVTSDLPTGVDRAKHAMVQGESFTGPARDMGRALGTFHADLAGAFGAHPQTPEQLGTLATDVGAELARTWESVRDEVSDSERTDLDPVVEGLQSQLSQADEPLQLHRIHGDLGLGHTHLFESGAARWVFTEDGAMVEHAPPLRDVISMLMSFAHLVLETDQESAKEAGPPASERVNLGQWYEDVTQAFLEGYRHSEADGSGSDSVFFRAVVLAEAMELFNTSRDQQAFRPSMLVQARG